MAGPDLDGCQPRLTSQATDDGITGDSSPASVHVMGNMLNRGHDDLSKGLPGPAGLVRARFHERRAGREGGFTPCPESRVVEG